MAHVHMAPPILADANDAELRASERMYFEGLVQRVEERWEVPITTMLLDGPVAPTLHEYATTCQADLIVMTTHGRGALSRFWLGSISDSSTRGVWRSAGLSSPTPTVPLAPLLRSYDELRTLQYRASVNRCDRRARVGQLRQDQMIRFEMEVCA